jgi:hypothetical protein
VHVRQNLVFIGIVVGVLALGAALAWAMFAAAHSPTSANRANASPAPAR